MIGDQYPSEKTEFRDEKTGRRIVQLTGGSWENTHLYFTDNSFSLNDKEIYFVSSRTRGPGTPSNNFFRMDLESGRITQVTDEPLGVRRCTKTPDSTLLVYVTGNQLKAFDTRTGVATILHEERQGCGLMSPFLEPGRKYVGFIRTENIGNLAVGANYAGFTETMYATKRSWVSLAWLDGSGSEDVYEDTHWLGHFQFSPDDGTVATFCHEGPWNLVHQRIWLLDLTKRRVVPCFRQGRDDCVGHEFWTRDGQVFFDNRGAGHDGTITSERTQATVHEESGSVPWVGFADKTGVVTRRIDLPYYCNHYHANNDNSLLVGDAVDDLQLISLTSDRPTMEPLCVHGTSWRTGDSHCHPTFGWNGTKILYLSDRQGPKNLYLIDLAD